MTSTIVRRTLMRLAAALLAGSLATAAAAQTDPLPSWNDGPTKQRLLDFVRQTTTAGAARRVALEERIATFDQDGTLWVEQPVYPQVLFALDRLPVVVKERPELAAQEPFRTALSGDLAAIARLPASDLDKILMVATGELSVEAFRAEAAAWLASARDRRWQRLHTELTYQPMQELLRHLRDSGYRTYIVTGGGQDFVRAYAERVYGIPPEQVVGSAVATRYAYDKDGRPTLMRLSTVLLDDNFEGKPEGIHLMIGRRPRLAAGNSTGDRQMLEYTGAGAGARLSLLVLHDDAEREYAYGPALGLPPSSIGTFPQSLYDEAQQRGWQVISMKRDWKRIFAWEP